MLRSRYARVSRRSIVSPDQASQGAPVRVAAQDGLILAGSPVGADPFGSVNDLHFQVFPRLEPLPVAHPGWRHMGVRVYPLAGTTSEAVGPAWDRIARPNEVAFLQPCVHARAPLLYAGPPGYLPVAGLVRRTGLVRAPRRAGLPQRRTHWCLDQRRDWGVHGRRGPRPIAPGALVPSPRRLTHMLMF